MIDCCRLSLAGHVCHTSTRRNQLELTHQPAELGTLGRAPRQPRANLSHVLPVTPVRLPMFSSAPSGWPAAVCALGAAPRRRTRNSARSCPTAGKGRAIIGLRTGRAWIRLPDANELVRPARVGQHAACVLQVLDSGAAGPGHRRGARFSAPDGGWSPGAPQPRPGERPAQPRERRVTRSSARRPLLARPSFAHGPDRRQRRRTDERWGHTMIRSGAGRAPRPARAATRPLSRHARRLTGRS
jgi:hypothetical protein